MLKKKKKKIFVILPEKLSIEEILFNDNVHIYFLDLFFIIVDPSWRMMSKTVFDEMVNIIRRCGGKARVIYGDVI